MLLCLTISILAGPLTGQAQDYQWLTGGTYNPEVPPPQVVIGHEIGTYLSDHHQMEQYIERLQATSDRVRILPLGESIEHRKMYLLVISSPSNLARIDEIRERLGKLADPRKVTSAEAEEIIRSTPPIGWLNYANDGGETAAFEAGLQVAYQLAAGTDPLTTKILEKTVVIINPVANPDSHQTFVGWMKANSIGINGTADPAASEHHVPWFISSDGNHYLIDSNRDAFALTQPETQAISRALQYWHPQLWIDNHGEPDEYYFAPFCAPMNLNYPPRLRELATEVGRSCAKYFDRMGWTYTKDEEFDLFFPGYWDSYPALHGTVSATYETNGGGWKHLSWERPDGSISTLRGGTHAHFLADLASLEILADRPAEFLRYFHDFYRTGMEEAKSEKVKAYLFPPVGDPGRVANLVTLLRRHGAEVGRVERSFRLATSHTYFDKADRASEVPAGTYVVQLEQPRKRLLKTLLEENPQMEESFLKSVEEIAARNRKLGSKSPKERLGFYDVTAWALPLSFGVETVMTGEDLPRQSLKPVTDEDLMLKGGVEGFPAAYAYLFDGNTDAGAALAGRLLQRGFKLAVITRPFARGNREFRPGSYIARVERNPGTLHAGIKELAETLGVEVMGVGTAWSDEGISLGSAFIVDLKQPRIMVFADEPTTATGFGGVYALLDQRFGLNFTAVRSDYLEEVDLAKYNVIILPDGSATGYRRLLGEDGIERLRGWVERGGTLIGLKGGAEFTTLEGVELTDMKFVTEIAPKEEESKPADAMPIQFHPGSIFKVGLNNEFALGYGYPSEIAVLFRGDSILLPTEEGTNVATFGPASWIQGQRWEDTEKVLNGSTWLADCPLGKGRLILFAGDPAFRAQWQGLDRLLVQAVLLGPTF